MSNIIRRSKEPARTSASTPSSVFSSILFNGKNLVPKSSAGYNLNDNAKHSSSLYVSNLPNESSVENAGSCLLLVDPQNDFVTGSLKVDGAIEDCEKIANFIEENIDELCEIYVTMDTHMEYHVAHPIFWLDTNDEHPKPFTQIYNSDIKEGKYRPVHDSMKKWVDYYSKKLEESGRFVLTIWPPHCLVGTSGHNVVPVVSEALRKWEKLHTKTVHYIFKGNNSKTEHYSAFKAEVVVPEDRGTKFNTRLLRDLKAHSKVYIAGEARSHCVNFTARDLVKGLGAEKAREKVVLLEGAMSDVVGCKAQGDRFWDDMTGINRIPAVDITTCKVVAKGGIETIKARPPVKLKKTRKAKTTVTGGDAASAAETGSISANSKGEKKQGLVKGISTRIGSLIQRRKQSGAADPAAKTMEKLSRKMKSKKGSKDASGSTLTTASGSSEVEELPFHDDTTEAIESRL